MVGYSRQASIPSCCLGSPSSSRSAFVERISGERIFSSCTYFDAKLRNRLGPQRFEMAVLLTVNRVWMEEMLKAEPLSKEDIDEAAEEVLKFFGIDNVGDLVQDEDENVVFDLTSDVDDLDITGDVDDN